MMSAMVAQQMDWLMHTDTVDWMMCQYGCSTDGLVDAHGHYGCSVDRHADAH